MTTLNEIQFFELSWKYSNEDIFRNLQEDREEYYSIINLMKGKDRYRIPKEIGVRITR